MLKLYFSKGSSALAAHILLQETGAPYDAVEISIPDGRHQTPEFLSVTPKGRLPVLQTSDGILTENPAILEYIAAVHPEAGMMPNGLFQQAQARSLCAYLCATAHVAFAHKQRGTRWASTVPALDDMRQKVAQNLTECATYLEGQFTDGPWLMGGRYSFCDPYLFLMERWMAANALSLVPYPKLAAHNIAMRARAATGTVLAVHGLG